MSELNDDKSLLSIFMATILVFISVFALSIDTKAAYVSHSLKSRYVYNSEVKETYKFPLIFEMNYEQSINIENIYGELNIKPLFQYNLDDEKEKIDFKEAYLDLHFSKIDLRIGKQKLTWGKSDGLVVTNIVNPRDYTVHPVVEFSEQMQGVKAIKGNIYSGNANLELVFIPEFKAAKMDKSLLLSNVRQGFTLDYSQRKIKNDLENSEIFLRYSSLGQNVDFEVVAAYSWEDIPTLYKSPQEMKIKPQHNRLTTVGGSLSTMKGPFVLRGEGAYISGEYFNLKNPLSQLRDSPVGLIEKDKIKWLAGVDYNYKGYLISTQFMQEAIINYEQDIRQDEYRNQMTFLVKKDFLRTKLNTEINFHYNLNDEILMAKPSLSYDYADSIKFKTGANLNIDGEVAKDNVVYIQTEYLF
jgi:hypothetical protein